MAGSTPRFEDSEVRRLYTWLEKYATSRSNARPARVIVESLNLGADGDRRLRAMAARAIELGLLMVADNAGYFIPTSRSEIDEAIGRWTSQATEMLERARRTRDLAAVRFPTEQLSLFAGH